MWKELVRTSASPLLSTLSVDRGVGDAMMYLAVAAVAADGASVGELDGDEARSCCRGCGLAASS